MSSTPSYLVDQKNDPAELRLLKEQGRIYAEKLWQSGSAGRPVHEVAFHDLGTDMPSPINAIPTSESKILACIRYCIEHYSAGRSSPLWRERYSEFRRLHEALILTPLAAAAAETHAKRVKAGSAKKARKLPGAAELLNLLERHRKNGDDERTAKSRIAQRYGVTTQGLNKAIRAAKENRNQDT